MFTGIVQCLVIVDKITQLENQLRLQIQVEKLYAKDLLLGGSVSINGVCLSLVSQFEDEFWAYFCFDVCYETLLLTNLSKIQQGDSLNFERSLTLGSEIGGHFLSGHIFGTAKVLEIDTQMGHKITFSCEFEMATYIFKKGFIGINGVSLTVNSVELKLDESSFSVSLIPDTLKKTNLSLLKKDDKVNIEVDHQSVVIVETITRVLERKKIC